MPNKFIPVSEPFLQGNEKKYLSECIDSGWISSEGPFVSEFEEKFSKLIGRKYAIAVSSGTAAIDLAVESLNLKPGDEIIMPTFTIISCINQILRLGVIPIFIDCTLDTWNMRVEDIEQKINSKTKAIMVVHIYGLPVDMNPILNLVKNYGLKIIEDASEMHGQSYYNKPCGSFGDISTFSFYSNKLITTGEGGIVLTDDDETATLLRSLRNLCFDKERRFIHSRLGWNYRMTSMQAALGLAQLENLNLLKNKKISIGQLYNDLFSSNKNIFLPIEKTEYANNIYWVYGIVLNSDNKMTAADLIEVLKINKIGARHFFYPMHLQPVLKDTTNSASYPNSEYISKFGLYIPSYYSLTSNEQCYIASVINEATEMNVN